MDTIVDLYPSRTGGKPGIRDRQDPVVHGRCPGPLTEAELYHFDREGYLFLPAFFAKEEVETLVAACERLRDAKRQVREPGIIHEPGSSEVRSIFEIHKLRDPLGRLCRDERVVARARQILGSEIYVSQSRMNYKPGFKGKEFAWHSDFETWHVEDGMPRMRALSCSILLSDNNRFNGPLMLVPRSHRHYVACAGRTPERHFEKSLAAQEYGVPDAESLTWLVDRYGLVQTEGPAGSLVMFDCNTMHGSNGNITPFPRANLFVVYNSVENLPLAPFGGREPRPSFLSSRDFSPV
jgi:ectoine hydroxylase